ILLHCLFTQKWIGKIIFDIVEKQKMNVSRNISSIMKNKRKFIVVLILLLGFLFLYSLVFKQPLKISSLQEKPIAEDLNNGQVVDYFSINDDDVILKNGRYSQPDNRDQKLIPTELREFLLNDYYSTHSYTYPDIKINLDCSFDDSEFISTEVDLNEDGKKEYLLMPYEICNTPMRGASGNGDVLIIRSINNTFEVFGQLHGNSYFISKNKTNGYFDILTNSHGSAASGTETLYKYQIHSFGTEGNAYEEAFSKWYDLSRVEKSYGESD